MSRLYLLEHGRVQSRPLTRPEAVPGLDGSLVAAPGRVSDAAAGLVGWVAAEVGRVAPWARCYCAPQLWSLFADGDAFADVAATTRRDRRGRTWAQLGGQAWHGHGVLAVSLARACALPNNTHHELWHMVSRRLPATDRQQVYAAVHSALRLDNDYADDVEEQAARLYAAWSEAWLHGLPPRSSECPVEAVLWSVYSGAAGAALA